MKMSNETCNPFGKCEEQSGKVKAIFCSEKGKTYEYINKSSNFVVKIRVDECLIKGEQQRKCDFMVLSCGEQKTAYLVELKGSDLEHAAKQILNVIQLFQKELSNFEIHARIVLSKVYQRDIESEDYIKLKRKLKNRIKHKNILLSETI